MLWLTELGRRFRMLFRGEAFDRELQEEMRQHVEMRQQAFIRDGLPPAAARSAAQRQFGNATLLRESSSALTFPARIRPWSPRGLDPALTYCFTISVAYSDSGCVARMMRAA